MGLSGLHTCFGVGSDEKNQEGRSEQWTQRRRKKEEYDVPYTVPLWANESVCAWLNWWRLHLHGYLVSLITIRLELKLRTSRFFFFGKPHENVTCYSTTNWQRSFWKDPCVNADIHNYNFTMDKNWMQANIANKTVYGHGFKTINIKSCLLQFKQKLCTITPENLALTV